MPDLSSIASAINAYLYAKAAAALLDELLGFVFVVALILGVWAAARFIAKNFDTLF